MKKLWIPILATTIGLSSIPLAQANEVHAAQVVNEVAELKVHTTPVTFRIIWSEFNEMIAGNYENRFEAHLKWDPIITDAGDTEQYKVSFKRQLEDHTWRTYNYTTKDTAYTIPNDLHDASNYQFVVTPKINGRYVDKYAISEVYHTPVATEQVSPVLFNSYVSEERAVNALANELRLKVSYYKSHDSVSAQAKINVTDNIRREIMSIYLNSGYIHSNELINDAEGTLALLNRAEASVIGFGFTSPVRLTPTDQEIMIACLLGAYYDNLDTYLSNINAFLEILNNMSKNPDAYSDEEFLSVLNALSFTIGLTKNIFEKDIDRISLMDNLSEEHLQILKAIYSIDEYDFEKGAYKEEFVKEQKSSFSNLGNAILENKSEILATIKSATLNLVSQSDLKFIGRFASYLSIHDTYSTYYNGVAGKQLEASLYNNYGNFNSPDMVNSLLNSDIWDEGAIGQYKKMAEEMDINKDMNGPVAAFFKKYSGNDDN